MNRIKQLSRLRKKKKKPTIEDAIKWLNSDEGKKGMARAMKRADKAVEYYRKLREPDWSRIHEPMTI